MRLNVCIFSREMGVSMSSVADYEWGGGCWLIVGSSHDYYWGRSLLKVGSINSFHWKVVSIFGLDVFPPIAPYLFVSHSVT